METGPSSPMLVKNTTSTTAANYESTASSNNKKSNNHHYNYSDHSEVGEFYGDAHAITIPININLYIFAFCAALNSCNLGYDIGVNTAAAQLMQNDMELSNVQLEIFMGSLNLWAMVGA